MSRYYDLIELLRDGTYAEDVSAEAADEMEAVKAERDQLLAFARRDGPLFRHKRGTLYQEVKRSRAFADYTALTRLQWSPGGLLVTDDTAQGEETVIYRNAKDEYFLRPARLFDEPDRFTPLG